MIHKDLKIPMPRPASRDLRLKPYWDLIRKHGGSRKKMVDFICSIGGYSSYPRDRFAIEFNVAAYGADLDVDSLWKLVTSPNFEEGPDPKLPPEHMAQAKALFWRVHEEHKEQLWEWGTEEAWEDWKDSDTPYETWLGERVDWEFGLYGRGGKHLCMESCEGIDLKCSPEDLQERLDARETDGEYLVDHAKVRKLFIICVQNTVELTPEKVAREVEYRAAWRLWVSFCEDELPKVIAQYEQRQELSNDAGLILDALSTGPGLLRESFQAICKLADVRIGE
jgi:hypothetical protein